MATKSEEKMVPVESTSEQLALPLPVLVTLSVFSALVIVLVGLFVLCCCHQKKKRKHSTASSNFILPNKTSSPSFVQTAIQDTATPELDVVFESQQERARAKRYSFSGASSSRSSAASINFRRSSSMSVFDIVPDDVNIGMYCGYESGVDDPKSPSVHGLGKLCFSLSFDEDNEKFSVTLVRALFLSPRRVSRMSADPYVKLVLLPDKRLKYVSKIVRKTLNPVFDETFEFVCSKENLESKTLKMTVCDYDRFARQSVMGYVIIELKELNFESTPLISNIWRDLYDGSPTVTCRGQLLVSLTFDPMGTIRVGILKAKDLPEADREIDGVFVKVGLHMSDKLVKTKKTKLQRRSSSPVFNDEFTFHVHASVIGDVSFSVSVQTKNAFGKNVTLGKTSTGSFVYSTGQGLAHWSDMLAAPRSSVAQWHVL